MNRVNEGVRRAILAMALVMSGAAEAQQCESVIALSRLVQQRVYGKDLVEQHASSFCKEYQESKSKGGSMSASASYKFLSGSFGKSNTSSEEVASKYCGATDNSVAVKDSYNEYVELIAPGAYGAYAQCVRMNQQEMYFDVSEGSVLPDQFTMNASYRPVGSSDGAKVQFSSSSGITCSWQGSKKVQLAMPRSSTATLNCSRQNQQKPGFVTVVRTDVGGVPQSMTLPWRAYDRSGVPVDALVALQTRVGTLEDQLRRVVPVTESLRSKGKVLGILNVQSGKVVSSHGGLTFDPSTGVVSVSNPDNLPFIPLVTDYYQGDPYFTETHFINDMNGNTFRVRRKSLDTSAQNQLPTHFTAVVVGF